MRSSPTRTFSPSDLCFDAGWIVHQHASPNEKELKKFHLKQNRMSFKIKINAAFYLLLFL